MNQIAETLFDYLYNAIYSPGNAELDIEELPDGFQEFGEGLKYFVQCIMETRALVQALIEDDLAGKTPSSGNEIASPMKSLHASLRHLTWQTKQVARGDYQQRVKFLGEFATAFNSMTQHLEDRRKLEIKEKSTLQQYISLILTNTPDIFILLDTVGKAVLVNEAFPQNNKTLNVDNMKGMSLANIFADIATEEFLQKMDCLINEALSAGKMAKIEQSIDFRQNGDSRAYMINVTPILCEDETMIGVMVVFHDTTELIQARSEAEKARELAEQSTRAKSDFLARMSHEMRTPMNVIVGMSSIGISATGIEKKDYSLQQISEASKHLLGVINDILDMSKIEADKFELSYSAFYFKSMLSHIMSIINFQVTDKEQILTIDIDGSIPKTITSDEQHLAQVITNLLSNAVKFTPQHGRIALSAKKTCEKDGYCTIRFTVKDNGIGITEEQQKHLFIPFEQADGSISRKFGGTGLGLAISKRIVEMLGGSIWVESEIDRGSSFIFDVIVRNSEDVILNVNAEAISHVGEFAGRRVLIAEDVDINREIVSALLEDTGIDIGFAIDGREAVEKFYSVPDAYDLILMDIQMPYMDGYEATKRIRSSGLPEADEIPIIAMTANVFNEDITRCLSAGMNDHLGKPVDVNEVITKIREYLPKRKLKNKGAMPQAAGDYYG